MVGSAEQRAALAARRGRSSTVLGWLVVAGFDITILLDVSMLGADMGLARPARDVLVIAVALVLAVLLYVVRSVRRRRRGR